MAVCTSLRSRGRAIRDSVDTVRRKLIISAKWPLYRFSVRSETRIAQRRFGQFRQLVAHRRRPKRSYQSLRPPPPPHLPRSCPHPTLHATLVRRRQKAADRLTSSALNRTNRKWRRRTWFKVYALKIRVFEPGRMVIYRDGRSPIPAVSRLEVE